MQSKITGFVVISIFILSLTTSISNTAMRINVSAATQQPPGSVVTEYPVTTPDSGPYAVAAGRNDTLWFTEYWKGKLANLNPQNRTIHEFTIPETNAQPVGLAVDLQNRIWIADENNPSGFGRIWQFNPANVTFTKFATKTHDPIDFFVLVDKSNNVWFSELAGNNLAEIPAGSTTVTEYPLPTANSGPSVLASQNGTSYIWISEYYANRLARFDTITHMFQEFTPSPSLKGPLGIAADLAGNIWVSEHGGSSVDQFIVSNSTLRKYPTAMVSGNITAPATVSIDNAGRVWFVEHVSNKVGRLNPATHSTEEFVFLNTGSYSLQGFGSTLDSNANFWFTLFSGNAIGMVQGNVTTGLKVTNADSTVQTVTAGQSSSLKFVLSNPSPNPITVSLDSTSTFATRGSSNQVSLSTRTVSLRPYENQTVTSVVTPDTYSTPGEYGIGIVAISGNASTIGVGFLMVQPSVLYLVGIYLPEIIVFVIAVATLSAFMFLRRRSIHRTFKNRSAPKLTLLVIGTLTFIMFGLNQVETASGKCPGLPPSPVQPNGTTAPDYFGLTLDIVSVAFFGIVAYLLIRGRMKRRKPPTSGPS